ncbi:MAG: hypothetical protein HYT50_00510 [Candidatus Wildermuthbacteria bacterium]|nr:hypothetical protein [Candidatus Wildermuthbacteria bacterium]
METIKRSPTQEILHMFLKTGVFVLAAQSPYFWLRVYKRWFAGESLGFREPQIRDAFRYLRSKRFIEFQTHNHQIYMRLTEEGKKAAHKFQINTLAIFVPKQWDGKWRLIIFDIPEVLKVKREAFRGKLREFGFYRLQKSIWVFPYSCAKEIMLLREFFALRPNHLRILEVQKLEEDEFLRRHFKLGK